jgi:guanylate kinase
MYNFIVITGVSAAGKDSVLRGLFPKFVNSEDLARLLALEDRLDGLITKRELNLVPKISLEDTLDMSNPDEARKVIKEERSKIMVDLYPDMPIWPVRSHATRPKRPGEIEDVYKFITRQEFEEGMKENFYMEWAIVFEDYKGTPVDEVRTMISEGKIPIKLVDAQGARSLSQCLYPDILPYIVFIDIPEAVMIERISKRRRDSEEQIQTRIADAVMEREVMAKIYDKTTIYNIGHIYETRQQVYAAIIRDVLTS